MTAVSVSQQDGEIILTKAGDTPIVYPVSKGSVDVPENELSDFLTSVSGSAVVVKKAAE